MYICEGNCWCGFDFGEEDEYVILIIILINLKLLSLVIW